MKTLNVKTNYFMYKNCKLRLGNYMADGSLVVEIYNRQDGEIARLTVCLCDPTLSEYMAYIDTNNCPWAVAFLEENGLAEKTGRTKRSGYCIYPEMKFNKEKITQFEEEE